jgi:hypothetical protein
VDPLGGREVRDDISSPLAEGPTLEKLLFDPFWDRVSVDAVPELPLRARLRYFSIASASLSNIRVAIGDKVLLLAIPG